MKTYRVNWDEPPYVERKISAGSPEEACRKFLESETQSKNIPVGVGWGLFGAKIFSDHIVEAREVEPSGPDGASEGVDSVQVNFDLVERRSGWAVLQFLCDVICIIAGCVFLSKNVEIAGIAFIAIGVQAFFIGFLINVFTDIRWFLQESLKIQRKRKH